MSATAEVRYLSIEDIIKPDFFKHPQSVIGEAGNGFGKTHTMCKFSTILQATNRFDRIYILEYSQKGCTNVVNKLRKMGGFAVRHIGIDRACKNPKHLERVRQLGLPPSYACYTCPYFYGKQKIAFAILKDTIEQQKEQIIEPKLVTIGLDNIGKVCFQPLLRALVLNPSNEVSRKIRFPKTPIFVVPSQLILNHTVIGKWVKYTKRQRKPRKNVMIIDEADAVFYASLRVQIPHIELTTYDRKLLEMFSSSKSKLTKLEELYEEVGKLLYNIIRNMGFPTKDHLRKFNEIIEKADPLLRTIDYKRKSIIYTVTRKGQPTNIFKLYNTFMELTHIVTPEYALSTVEETNEGFIIEDYDFSVRALLDVNYPWKHFWKVVLTATFPTQKVTESRFLSFTSKTVLNMADRVYKKYANVYVSFYPLFDDDVMVNRNRDLPYTVPKLFRLLKQSRLTYVRRFGMEPRGACVWFGNSKQLRKFVEMISKMGVKVESHAKYALIPSPRFEIFLSYAGSAISRGIDLNQYDISVIVAPLLRPPRNLAILDVIDFARGVAEAIQSAMRIVRSPKPKRPKLVIIEKTMTKAFYAFFYPEWFKALVAESFIELDGL